ncbi:MAG TPA: hypothetical protein VN345_11570 [Blastocatellia bacterium]|nr:hypothetical protein [Blastocatellia bacterium]
MADSALLTFTVRSITSSGVEIEVKNTSGAQIAGPLLIEIQFPVSLVDRRLSAAVEQARTSQAPPNMASVAGIATVTGGLSVWVFNDPNENLIALRAVNYLDEKTGAELDAPVAIAADAACVLKVPITEQGSRTQVTVPYSYRHGGRKGQRVTGSLDITPADTGQWKPQVSLSIDSPNSTMLEPGSKVKISWSVVDGVSATLRGPLPGGHSELTLSKNAQSDFRMDKGSLEIYAVGQATYFLDVQVRNPRRQNIQVIRTLLIDTKSVDKFASLRVRPNRVLPNSYVDIDWAVWGVQKATLRIGERKSLALTLTEQDMSRYYQGTGTWSERAAGSSETVTLKITGASDFEPKRSVIDTAQWIVLTAPKYTGKPIGLAVAVPAMALLTTDGLWLATVGSDDRTSSDPKFRKVTTDSPKAWLALTAFEKGFAVLRQTTRPVNHLTMDVLQLVRYGPDGKPQGDPLDLPDFLSDVVSRPGAIFDLVGFGKRVYVVVEQRLFRGSRRHVLSVGFDPEETTTERLLERLQGYRLLSFANGLYALNPSSGQMLRFVLSDGDREIEEAYKAATAAKNGQSLIRTGFPVPIGNLLAILDPGSFSALKLLPLFGLTNVLSFALKDLVPESDEKQPREDLIYNPQRDEWTTCGQGLKLKPGAVAAFRGGDSERLWVLQPDGQMHTLTEASPELFAAKYVDKFPPAKLPPALNAERFVKIKNDSGWSLAPLQLSLNFGLDGFASQGLAEVDPPEHTFRIRPGGSEIFKVGYHQADPAPVYLRFEAFANRFVTYFLEVTLSGHRLSNISSVFKCAAMDRAETPSVVEVPGTLVQHPGAANVTPPNKRSTDPPGTTTIVIPPPKRLSERYKLIICNTTRYRFLLGEIRPIPLSGYREMEIKHDTEPFALSPDSGPDYHRLGQLYFEFNLALSHGIEISPRGGSQQSLLRIDGARSKLLAVENARTLSPGDPPVEVGYLLNDEQQRVTVSAPGQGVTYVCQIVERK